MSSEEFCDSNFSEEILVSQYDVDHKNLFILVILITVDSSSVF
jgi:hypothetical protein